MLSLRLLASKNGFAFLVSCIAGAFVTRFLPDTSWTVFAGMIVTYHLFLAFLVLSSDTDSSRSFSIPMMAVFHLAFLGVLLGARVGIMMASRQIMHANPVAGFAVFTYYGFFSYILRFGSTGALCYFERETLFSGGRKQKLDDQPKAPQLVTETPNLILQSTGADHEEWLRDRAQRKIPARPGLTPQQDFEEWLKARDRRRITAMQAEAATRPEQRSEIMEHESSAL